MRGGATSGAGLKFSITLEDIARFGPNVACARAYILKRTQGPTLITTRELALEMGMGAYIIREAVRSLREEDLLRFRKQFVGDVLRGVYEAKPVWGWR